MRRKVVSLILIFSIILPMCAVFMPKVSATENVIFQDDFESYAAGTFPSSGGWQIVWNGAGDQYQVITSSYSHSGSRSLQLIGQWDWSSVTKKDFSSSSDVIGYEGCMMTTSTAADGSIGFFNRPIDTWGRFYAAVGFGNGNVACGSTVFQPIAPYTWYKIRVVLDKNTRLFNVWINDALAAQNLVEPNDPHEILSLEVSTGWSGQPVYFDDVKVFEVSGPTPTGPVISSVSPITATNLQTIKIQGSGFGNIRPQTTPVGDGSVDTVAGSARASSTTPWMDIGDSGKYQKTGDTSDGGENWAAGVTDFRTVFCEVGIYITSWTDTEITLGGFGTYLGTNGQGTWYIEPGDPLVVDVFTPSGQASYHTNVTPTQSSTSVLCSPNPVSVSSSATCTATVSGSSPTGTVIWSTSSSTGTFSQNVCTLSSGRCSTTYTDSSPGTVTITASYSGDSSNGPSSGGVALTVLTEYLSLESKITRLVICDNPTFTVLAENQLLANLGISLECDVFKETSKGDSLLNSQILDLNVPEQGETLQEFSENFVPSLPEGTLLKIVFTAEYTANSQQFSTSCTDFAYTTKNPVTVRTEGTMVIVDSPQDQSVCIDPSKLPLQYQNNLLVTPDGYKILALQFDHIGGASPASITIGSSIPLNSLKGVKASDALGVGQGTEIYDLSTFALQVKSPILNMPYSATYYAAVEAPNDIKDLQQGVCSKDLLRCIDIYASGFCTGVQLGAAIAAVGTGGLDAPADAVTGACAALDAAHLAASLMPPGGGKMDTCQFWQLHDATQLDACRDSYAKANFLSDTSGLSQAVPSGGQYPIGIPLADNEGHVGGFVGWTNPDGGAQNLFWVKAPDFVPPTFGADSPDGWYKNNKLITYACDFNTGSGSTPYTGNVVNVQCLTYPDSNGAIMNDKNGDLSLRLETDTGINPSVSGSWYTGNIFNGTEMAVLPKLYTEFNATVDGANVENEKENYDLTVFSTNSSGYIVSVWQLMDQEIGKDEVERFQVGILQNGTLEVQARSPQYYIAFDLIGVGSDFIGTVVTVDGINYAASDLPTLFLWENSSAHTFAFQLPLLVGSGAKEYDWTSTTGLSTLQSDSITITGPGNVTGNYVTHVHDVAVTDVDVVVPHCSSKIRSDLWVFQRLPVYVNVTVLNKGDFDENVTVTLYCNITANQIIGSQNVTLSPGQDDIVAFVWDTTGVPYLQNYTLTAVATIPLDINPADNTQACGPITVRIMGDINGDGKVDGKDIATAAKAFGTVPGDPRWNLDCDINGDGKVDGKDIVLVARNFGK